MDELIGRENIKMKKVIFIDTMRLFVWPMVQCTPSDRSKIQFQLWCIKIWSRISMCIYIKRKRIKNANYIVPYECVLNGSNKNWYSWALVREKRLTLNAIFMSFIFAIKCIIEWSFGIDALHLLQLKLKPHKRDLKFCYCFGSFIMVPSHVGI